MKFSAIKFSHTNCDLISTVLPFEIINKYSKVLVYGTDDGGYQRLPDEKHLSKIKNYVVNNENFLFPTPIVLGVDSEIADKLINKDGELDFQNFKDSAKDIFRIVDGQHRIRGINEAAKAKPELNQLPLSVIIVITPPNSRSREMEIFNTINSKGKKIKVDLIQLASFDYRVLEQNIKPTDINEHISVQVANLLNEEKSSENKWYNAIKFGIHDEEKIGIIGVNAFRESLKPIVGKYLELNKEHENKSGAELIVYTKKASKDIKAFLLKVWEIVYNKWPECFSLKSQELDSDMEIKEFYYKSNYYIQKTLGAKAINYYLLGPIVNAPANRLDENTLKIFKAYIEKADILTSDWELGKTFSGYSSESAFNKVSKMIKGELTVPRS